MLIVVSPAKTLDYDSPLATRKHSEPLYLAESAQLIKQLQQLRPEDLCNLMHISNKLGELNYQRFANWQTPFTLNNARQAIFAFKGDVYLGLKAEQFSGADLNFAQKQLRILSGLYGLLRPLDLMQPYRLEMGTKFKNSGGKNLYEFWADTLTQHLNNEFAERPNKGRVLVNLASNEYFRSLQPARLQADIITPVFKDFSNGQYKVISFFAKKARGEMAAFLIRNRISTPQKIQNFNVDGYRFDETKSTANKPVFLRKQK